MTTTACADCGVSVFDRPLHRTNPLGESGVFKCVDCGGVAATADITDIVAAIYGESA